MRQSRQGRTASRAPEVAVGPLRRVDVTRTYLELRERAQLRPATRRVEGAEFAKRAPCSVPLYRRLYGEVGREHFWHERLTWSDEVLTAHLARPDIAVWEALLDGKSAGYFELRRDSQGGVEIGYFGLMPAFVGRGLGGLMLARATEEAWAMGATRVWLHTCTLDSPHALPNYKARGFVEFKTERLVVEIEGKTVISEQLLP